MDLGMDLGSTAADATVKLQNKAMIITTQSHDFQTSRILTIKRPGA